MKKAIFTLLATLVMTAMMAQTPAFPGAEGHGRYVTGGRGGRVVHVTNLNDKGTGSLRAAVQGSDKKIVVFDVGGVIALNSDLVIGNNTTIAGQTAPYPGITIRYYTVRPTANNIIRFIRVRRGEERNVNDGADAIWQREVTGIMLDHCSFSWSIDEVASFYDNNNFTMQWCTIAESLTNAGHGKDAHGYGGIWGGKLASFHHNLLQHLQNRTPRFNGSRYGWTGYTDNYEYNTYLWQNVVQAENVDFRNCVLYNWGTGGCYGGPGGGQINMVNNYYKAGPATSNKTRVTQVSVSNSGNSTTTVFEGMTSRYYISGNYVTAAGSNAANYDWKGVVYDSGVFTINGEKYSQDPDNYYGNAVPHVNNSSGVKCVRIKMDTPCPAGEVTTHSAENAFDKVLSYAGASLHRDNVDTRYANEARNGTCTYTGSVTKQKGIIDRVADVGGYTESNFGTGVRPDRFDTDLDGIPDAWETANGLNPNDASDAGTYTLDPEEKYYNLEVYLNSIVQDIMVNENADAEEAVDDYFPAYNKENGTHVDAINAEEEQPVEDYSFTITETTYVESNNTTTWVFQDGFSVTNRNDKGFTTGKLNGIKYSAGVQYTIHLPEDFKVEKMTFTGYDNYAEADAYIKECNGTEYPSTQYVFPKKDGSGAYTVVAHDIAFATPATGTITFTPAGKQVVLNITLSGRKGSEPAILLGDANGDGTVTVTDVTTMVDYILGNTPSVFNIINADVNQNGSIEITDITLAVDIILSSH
ncbi:MAG: pectate lyase [Prevotella sp.]|nr:pectate lyase [Prevotella sp.]